MRQTLNKIGLLGLCLLLSIFVIKNVNAAADIDVNISLSGTVLHTSRLHSLSLGSGNTVAVLNVTGSAGDIKLKFTKGLIVGDDSSAGSADYAVIGGGKGNKVDANYAGVGGGSGNEAKGTYAVIGGGQNNKAAANGVVVGGISNEAETNAVVLGGNTNKGLSWGVVLGGHNNTANRNSLVLGTNSEGAQNSFVWNGTTNERNGYINAKNGVLIGTTTGINGVNLVVSGAVQMAGSNENAYKIKGELRYIRGDNGGCFYAYDGDKWHVLNMGKEKERNPQCRDIFPSDAVAQYCEFGNTIVWNNDVVLGYSGSYAVGTGCDGYQRDLVCKNGHLYISGDTTLADNYYPYCYSIHN